MISHLLLKYGYHFQRHYSAFIWRKHFLNESFNLHIKQAYLRDGRPEQALVDCELALRLLPSVPKTTPTDIGEDADAAREINQQAAKACLRRGKALLVLRRPRDSLRAYIDARAFLAFSQHPATAKHPDPDSDEWPQCLREGVAQVKAAIAADSLDSQSSIQLSSSSEPLFLKSTE